MIKKIEIVSLSSGVLGEEFVKHEVDIGLKRLKDYGVEVSFGANALRGLSYLQAHPEARAEDLIRALEDESVDMILCAVGGDDTYRLLPHLFENDRLAKAARKKIFLGFSDTTVNHFMLHKVGLTSFYGQAFLPDVCELADTMRPYSEQYFSQLIHTGRIDRVTPSPVWYDVRENFALSQIGTDMPSHKDRGFELLQGPAVFRGPILGGCIDTIFDMFNNERHADSVALCQKYQLFPSLEDWRGRILLLESSEEKPSPEKYRRALTHLKEYGLFEVLAGLLIGKPENERYFDEYKQILVEVVDNPDFPIMTNLNIGHASPRCILPFGVPATVSVPEQTISFDYSEENNS